MRGRWSEMVLAGVSGALPTNRLAELADVLHALLRVSAGLAGWLQRRRRVWLQGSASACCAGLPCSALLGPLPFLCAAALAVSCNANAHTYE